MIQSDLLRELCIDDDEYQEAITLIKKNLWDKESLIEYVENNRQLPERSQADYDLST